MDSALAELLEWVRSMPTLLRSAVFLLWIIAGYGLFFGIPYLRDRSTSGQTNNATQAGGDDVVNSAQANAAQGSTATANNRSVTANVYVENVFQIEDVASSREQRQLQTPSGITATADIYVLWQEGAWRFDSDRSFLRSERVDDFLGSSLLQSTVSDSAAIVCIGLASNEPNERSSSSSEYNLDLSNRRAFRLCDLLAGRAAVLHANPKLFGVGLGSNTTTADDSEARQKQRAVVFIAVRGRQPLSRADIDATITQILRDGSLRDFQPQQYSHVVNGEPLHWVSVERGAYRPPNQ